MRVFLYIAEPVTVPRWLAWLCVLVALVMFAESDTMRGLIAGISGEPS